MEELNTRASGLARIKRAEAVALRRDKEKNDAWDFRWRGHDGHLPRCIFGVPCAYEYDPLPLGEILPDRNLYEGTRVGALYGYADTERHMWELAGWNLV